MPFLFDPRAIKLEREIRMKNLSIQLIIRGQNFSVNLDVIDDIQMIMDDAAEQNIQVEGENGIVPEVGDVNIDGLNGGIDAVNDLVNDTENDDFSGNIEFRVEVSINIFK